MIIIFILNKDDYFMILELDFIFICDACIYSIPHKT